MFTAEVRWTATGTEHAGAEEAQSTVEIGDPVEIWVDDGGSQGPGTNATTRAAEEAVTVALVIWMICATAAAALFTLTRVICDRIRSTGWQNDIDSLVGTGDGNLRLGQHFEC